MPLDLTVCFHLCDPQLVVAKPRFSQSDRPTKDQGQYLARIQCKIGDYDPDVIVGGKRRRRSGGKPAADKLLKPVKASSKRGRFLEWFIAGNGRIEYAMDHFGMTRNSVMTYWATLNRDHGIGYHLVDDNIELILPIVCDEVFK